MKKFKANVNGKEYIVEIEEITNEEVPVAAMKKQEPVAKPVEQPKAAVQSKPAQAAVAVGAISAPMPGTIQNVQVKEGDTVQRGDLLLILEAMKMENEIMAPADGVVKKVFAVAGEVVNTGDILVEID